MRYSIKVFIVCCIGGIGGYATVFWGNMSYMFWSLARLGFEGYNHCKTVMIELGGPPNTCPFPWSCVAMNFLALSFMIITVISLVFTIWGIIWIYHAL